MLERMKRISLRISSFSFKVEQGAGPLHRLRLWGDFFGEWDPGRKPVFIILKVTKVTFCQTKIVVSGSATLTILKVKILIHITKIERIRKPELLFGRYSFVLKLNSNFFQVWRIRICPDFEENVPRKKLWT